LFLGSDDVSNSNERGWS